MIKIELWIFYLPIILIGGFVLYIMISGLVSQLGPPEIVEDINVENCDIVEYDEVKYPDYCDEEKCCDLMKGWGECMRATCERIH